MSVCVRVLDWLLLLLPLPLHYTSRTRQTCDFKWKLERSNLLEQEFLIFSWWLRLSTFRVSPLVFFSSFFFSSPFYTHNQSTACNLRKCVYLAREADFIHSIAHMQLPQKFAQHTAARAELLLLCARHSATCVVVYSIVSAICACEHTAHSSYMGAVEV